ncbi:MAG: cytidylate kinase-like family protein [Muribaculaceae bacterium]|nr:cytidylate kinase-like family protein [Muribaculaceae bacterium]
MKKSDLVIVIGRQYGAGGRRLGRAIAQRLGLPYFDKELLQEAAERFGFNKSVFETSDEKRPSLLHSLLNFNYNSVTYHFCTSAMNADDIYTAQSRVIRQLAEEGPCVIVGRTADYILRDMPGLISIFVHADLKTRALRIVDRGECSSEPAASDLAEKQDKLRRNYYNYFTGRNWGEASVYNLCIDSTHLSVDEMADLVMTFIEFRMKSK